MTDLLMAVALLFVLLLAGVKAAFILAYALRLPIALVQLTFYGLRSLHPSYRRPK